ncbi:cell wall-binding repeat-containing protein [Euzebya sp.]|uniref:cell wall-binding repeat-containing protein n=1 Tax=Euzebya sp. TaxID=1971409 RepID=UPI0035136FA5
MRPSRPSAIALVVVLAAALTAVVAAAPRSVAQRGASGRDDGITTVPDDVIVPTTSTDPAVRMREVAALAPSTTALLTTTADFPDALASGVLQDDAMLLPATRDALGPGVADLIRAADVTDVVVLGGTAAISDAALAELPDGVPTTRIGGAERTETAALIATAAAAADDTRPDAVLVARARGSAGNPSSGFIDAIGAGAWSAQTGWPVLLIDGDRVSEPIRQAVRDLDPDRVVVIGGTAAVSDAAVADLASGRPVERIAGAERAETAAAIATAARPDGAETVFLVDGTDPDAWVDGFPAAHPAALSDGVVLLSAGEELPAATRDAIADLRPDTITCLTATEACLAARDAAGMPPAIEVAVTPPPGEFLPAGADIAVTTPGTPDSRIEVVDDGGCATVGPDGRGRATAPAGTDCTVVIRVVASGRTAQTTTIRWPAVSIDRRTAVGGVDFATAVLGNRWDYAQPIDARVDPVIGGNAGSARVDAAAGVLTFGDRAGVTVPLLWANFPGAVPIAPDGLVNPVDANRFRHALIRVWASEPAGMSLEWRACTTGNCINHPTTQGRVHAGLAAGWQTVQLDLGAQPSWGGDLHQLYLFANAAQVRVDDVRFVEAPTGEAITVTADPAVQLTWDRDDDPSNNTDPTSPDHGPLVDGRLAADELPPGDYWIHTSTGATHGPVRLATPPAPIISAPSVESAPDYATEVRGNPWDFSPGPGPAGTDDLAGIGGVSSATTTADGVLHATNGGNDPWIELAMAGPLDPNRWHTVTIDFDLEGPMRLEDAPGGGAHGRILFRHAGSATWRNGAEIVAYDNQRRFTIDMRRPDAVEPGTPAWTAAPITAIRFDPNEDPGARRWSVDRIRLTGAVPAAGSTPLTIREAGIPDDGQRTVRWTAAPSPAGGGQAITPPTTFSATPHTTPGTTCGLTPGTWWVTAQVTDADGRTGSATGRTPLVVQPC